MDTKGLITSSLREGAHRFRRRWSLALLIYAVNLAAALLLAAPVFQAVAERVGSTGYGADLILEFDLMLWREIVAGMGDAFAGLGLQLLITVPLYWVWKIASRMGLIYALHNGAIWPFWRGVGAYAAPGVLLGLIFLPLKVLWVFVSLIVAASVRSAFPGEVGVFWSIGVLLPTLAIFGWAVLDLFQRYARLALIVRHDTLWNAFRAGISWPFNYGAASYLYVVWFFLFLGVTLITIAINAQVHVGVSALVLAFLVQQISLFSRACVTVAWIGSETALFERSYIAELPLIADAREIPGEMYEGGASMA